ncbi:PREDICTED: RNA polymerase II-associated protein 3 [Drosophila arizonae]|uniref:RNA polymerase II-associated protein 3 n=1 Tax=Drosophila arizonae TaxID=7263 RepID=A0ABM1PFF0_DROAR|nr:PREDICTED: RNA polymerase II-associated protein 3 [Drosophila arizonae]
MSSEKKAMDLQFQVRQNAREYQNSVKDLYSWEKEIKSKELAMQNAPAPKIKTNNIPVRSHVQKTDETVKKPATSTAKGSSVDSAASTPTEKKDFPIDTLAQQHKKANDIKDRGNSYVKLSEYEKAIEAYTEAIEVYPQDPIFFINRALCYLKQESYDNCIDDCDAAIELDKLCVKAYYRRMQANESLGNNMEALKDCTTVLAIDPKNYEAKRSLERINDRLRKIATKNGPSFSPDREDFVDILPFEKPASRRSKQSMRRVPVVDIVTPRPGQEEQKQLRISDEEIDKIFNSNCGPFEEVKKPDKRKVAVDSNLEVNEKLNVKIQETKQTANQSTVKEDSSQSTKKVIETVLPDLVQPATESNQSIKIVEKPDNLNKTTSQPIMKENDITPVAKPSEIEMPSTSNTTKIVPEDKKVTAMERIPPAPSGTAQFYMTWKELSPNQKYQYLKSIEIPNLCKILGAGFDSDTFTDLLRTLNDFYVPNKEPTTAAVMLEISKNDEFSILSIFMSPEDKNMAACILDAISKFPKNNPGLLEKLGKLYHVA